MKDRIQYSWSAYTYKYEPRYEQIRESRISNWFKRATGASLRYSSARLWFIMALISCIIWCNHQICEPLTDVYSSNAWLPSSRPENEHCQKWGRFQTKCLYLFPIAFYPQRAHYSIICCTGSPRPKQWWINGKKFIKHWHDCKAHRSSFQEPRDSHALRSISCDATKDKVTNTSKKSRGLTRVKPSTEAIGRIIRCNTPN